MLERVKRLNIKGLDVFLMYEVPPHIPEYFQFRLQPKHGKLFHVIFHTLSPSLPAPTPAHTSHPVTPTFLQADTQSSTPLCSICPNHLNLHTSPHQPHSEHLEDCTSPHCTFCPPITHSSEENFLKRNVCVTSSRIKNMVENMSPPITRDLLIQS